MSMCHKAYALDYGPFRAELAPVLYEALLTGRDADLSEFISTNLERLTYPWEAKPLPTDWRSVLEVVDIHTIGDIALTKYYDADQDYGIQEHWMAVEAQLPESARVYLLGEQFGPTTNFFDPGRMGSYFQSPSLATRARQVLTGRTEPELEPFLRLLDQVATCGKGLYITF